ncbi:POK9 protein, partial [Bombycilla garrulus]|nr:POK9 protein [Bombycilla garrulus]
SGSLGLDLAAATDIPLIDNWPAQIPTSVWGPVQYRGKLCGALLLGRSSASLKGLFILPRVIDADFTGEIIIASAWFPPLHIPKGSRIAQLVPTLQLTEAATAAASLKRGTAGFGSTGGLALLCLPMDQRPQAPVLLESGTQQCQLMALLDTGVDITII